MLIMFDESDEIPSQFFLGLLGIPQRFVCTHWLPKYSLRIHGVPSVDFLSNGNVFKQLFCKFSLSLRECKSLNVEKQGRVNFPIHHSRHIIYGTAVVVKINFPIRGFAAHGEIYLHHSCSAIYYVPFVIHGEIFFLLSWLRHSRRKIPSLFLHIKGLGHSILLYLFKSSHRGSIPGCCRH